MTARQMSEGDWQALRFHANELFTPSSPMQVTELFAGRSEQLQVLADTIAERGRHAILYGEPGVGKTSAVNILRFFIPNTPHKIHYIRHPVVSSDTYSSIWKEIFRSISFALPDDDVPRSVKVSELYADGVTQNDVIRELAYFSEATIPIIVIDEYQQFRDTDGAGYLSETIKGVSDAGLKATIVVVGVGDSVTELVQGHTSITRCCEEVLMPRMNSGELQQLLGIRITQLGMKIDGNAKWKIIGLTKGLPAFAHSLGKSAVLAAIERASLTVTEADVDLGIAAAVSSSKQTLKTTYEEATNSNQERARFKHLITACALTKTDASGWFTPKDVTAPFSRIMGENKRVDHLNSNLKEFATERRGAILDMKGSERAHRFRFADSAMQPYVLIRGIEAGLIDEEAMAILSSPEQGDLFATGR